jgi:hypothetical protein
LILKNFQVCALFKLAQIISQLLFAMKIAVEVFITMSGLMLHIAGGMIAPIVFTFVFLKLLFFAYKKVMHRLEGFERGTQTTATFYDTAATQTDQRPVAFCKPFNSRHTVTPVYPRQVWSLFDVNRIEDDLITSGLFMAEGWQTCYGIAGPSNVSKKRHRQVNL